jgi:hypothetical protein
MTRGLAGFRDVPDYIYGITRAIWEERGVGPALGRYYADDIVVRAATGLTQGNGAVAAQTLQTLHQFPDRQLVGEDVIWRRTGDRAFLSSHRLISVMRNMGDGALGPADGRLVRSRIIADCWVEDGVVKEEWLVRDQAAFAHCLGVPPRLLAERQLAAARQSGRPPAFSSAIDIAPRFAPLIEDDPVVAVVAAALDRLWNGKEPAALRDLYHPGATLFAPGGEARHGHGDIDRWAIGYLASFPDARFRLDSAHVNRDPEQPVRLALRWSIEGTHGGWGHFGEPSGAPVHVMGLSHMALTDGLVRQEWLLVDEVSIWAQILAAQPAAASDSRADT